MVADVEKETRPGTALAAVSSGIKGHLLWQGDSDDPGPCNIYQGPI